MLSHPNHKAPPNVAEVQTLRFGGAVLMDDMNTFKKLCAELSQNPAMLIAVAVSHWLYPISEGKTKDEITKEVQEWLQEEAYILIETGMRPDVIDMTCGMLADATATILMSLNEIMENGNLSTNKDGKTYSYELLKLSSTGTLVVGRSCGGY